METTVENPVDRLKGEKSTSSLSDATLLGGVLALTALVYAATVRFDFVYDDMNQIVRNALIQSWRFVPGYFGGHQWLTLFPNASANYYRPLNFVWFRVNDALFGLQPAGLAHRRDPFAPAGDISRLRGGTSRDRPPARRCAYGAPVRHTPDAA